MIRKPLRLSVVYSLISAKALEKDLLIYYQMPAESSVVLKHQGFHDTYLITTPSAKYVLRVYRAGWKTFEQVQAEVDLLLMLKQKQLDISFPLPDEHNNFIQRIESPEGERFAVVFSHAAGEPITSLNSDTAFLFGRHLAQVHFITVDKRIQDLQREYTVDSILNSTLAAIAQVLTKDGNPYKELETLCLRIKKRFTPVLLSALRSGICHGDPHHENAFFENLSGTITFFDFDFSGNGSLLYDIGSFCFYERGNEGNVKSFLEGYESVLPLTGVEKGMIKDFKVLMRLFHLGARALHADGLRTPIWLRAEIADRISEIKKETDLLTT